jgi:hypothetical protein
VERRGVQHGPGALERLPDDRAVGDRAGQVGELAFEQVEADDVAALLAQDAYERLSEVTRAAGDEDAHADTDSTRGGGLG